MIIFFLVSTILSTILPNVQSDFDVKKIRLKNGATIIYSSINWGQPTKIIGVFFKNGATLKFDKKTGLPALTQQILSLKIRKLSRELGFRYRSDLTWDYLAYILYLPPGMEKNSLSRIWSAFYEETTVENSDFNLGKNNIALSIKYDFEHKIITFPLISFMAHHNSIYSIGKYGSLEDVNSILPGEFTDFSRCYINPNNSVIISSAEKDIRELTRVINTFKPCFRDERFEDEGIVNLNVPGRSINYIKSEKKNFIIKLGFPSASCEKKESFIYDLIAEILKQDEIISALSGQIRINNQCYLNKGVFEIIFTDVKKDAEEITTKLMRRIRFLSSDLDTATLSLAKTELDKNFGDIIGNKESFVCLLGKTQISSGSYENFLNYLKMIETVKQPEVKEILKNISNENIYKMYIRQE
ncbi:MAG: hypothetical protein NTY22_03830 [Proteobacteria bacterium]|nr:hypothetical protein [Pseudomonadota bacterium]